METITIRIKDGMIVQVEDIPDNIILKIYDYDIDHGNENKLCYSYTKDEKKKLCFIYTYDSNDCRKENI